MTAAGTAVIIDEAIEKDHRRRKAMQHLQGTQRSRRYRIGAAAYLYAALCTAGVGAVATMARADYPERQITMIVCFPAGGGTDIAARLSASRWSSRIAAGQAATSALRPLHARQRMAIPCWSARVRMWSTRAFTRRRVTILSRISYLSW